MRIKGKIALTKIAGESLGDIQIGQPLHGAEFKLYKAGSNTPLKLAQKAPDDTHTHYYYVPYENGSETMTVIDSGEDIGKLYIEDLDWGQYYLVESKAPEGFAINTEQIKFSVGRNNCTTEQELTCKNNALKSVIKITKKLPVSEYRTNWGTPTFIFKIKQTDDTQKEMTVMLEVTKKDNEETPTYYYEATSDIEVEPGTYEVTEVKVARYSVESCSAVRSLSSDSSRNITISGTANIVTNVDLRAGERADFEFINKLDYLDKFSHSDSKTNNFNGYKALQVSYPLVVQPSTEGTAENGLYYTSLNKSNLIASLVKSSGETETISNTSDLVITRANTLDNDTRFTVKDNVGSDTFEVVSNPIISAGYIYKLKAQYTLNGQTYETTFDITFAEYDVDVKKTVRVVFKADSDRRSYFVDDTQTAYTDTDKTGVNRTDTYAMDFVLVKNTSDEWEIKSISHNGKAVSGDFMTAINNSLTVNDSYTNTLIFDPKNWKNGGTTKEYTYQQIENLVIQQVNADNTNDINIEAILTQNSN